MCRFRVDLVNRKIVGTMSTMYLSEAESLFRVSVPELMQFLYRDWVRTDSQRPHISSARALRVRTRV